MAGPCAHVYVGCGLDATDRLRRRVVEQVSESQHDGDFQVRDTGAIGGTYRGEGRPFCGRVSDRRQWLDEPNEYEQRELEKLLGKPPQSRVDFSAMCNDECDHRILAELCLRIARELNGIVCFLGLLHPRQTPDEWRSWQQLSAAERCARFATEVGTGDGTLTAFGLDAADDPAIHYADASFLEHWLRHPGFGMVK